MVSGKFTWHTLGNLNYRFNDANYLSILESNMPDFLTTVEAFYSLSLPKGQDPMLPVQNSGRWEQRNATRASEFQSYIRYLR